MTLFTVVMIATIGALVLWVARTLDHIAAQREQAEGEATEQREWLQVTLASIGDGVIATDAAGQVSFDLAPGTYSLVVTSQGFEAKWRVTHLATGGPSYWEREVREGRLAGAGGAGVKLVDPVNVYALSYRATEYGFLFVLFTFGALALTEALAGIRLHVVQYALTGSAIAIFFLLLLALSEHVPFYTAYAIAASACVLLLTAYLRHPLETLRRTIAFFALFVGLYASLYALLQSEDNALLMGSLMVFALLAFTMVATRKIDWAWSARGEVGIPGLP